MFHCKLYSRCTFLVSSLCKVEKGLLHKNVVTVTVPNILNTVLIIGKHGKPTKLSVILTLSEDKLCSQSSLLFSDLVLHPKFSC